MSDVDDPNDTQEIDDDEYDIEETYVVLDLGRDTPSEANSAGTKYQLVGMDTETPYLRFGDAYYKGIMDQTIGTEMIFQSEGGNIKHIGNTSKRVTFKRATVSLKNKAAYALAVRPIKMPTETVEAGVAEDTDQLVDAEAEAEASNGTRGIEDTPMQDAQDDTSPTNTPTPAKP